MAITEIRDILFDVAKELRPDPTLVGDGLAAYLASIDRQIVLYYNFVDKDTLKDSTNLATALYTAYQITSSNMISEGVSGRVTSEKIAQEQTNYQADESISYLSRYENILRDMQARKSRKRKLRAFVI